MTVQFILGRSGTGKTHYCVSAIVDALLQRQTRPLLFLVPEQATYQASVSILSDPRIAGYNRLRVLSFEQLVNLVLGKKPEISHMGRVMVIQKVLRDCADKLTVFKNSARLPGLGKRLSDTITQLLQYANTPDDIENLVQKLQKQKSDNLTAAKFADIAVIFKEYISFIKGRFLDPDIQLHYACRAVAKTDSLKGAKLWVDGFAGFTAAEIALLTELLKVAQDAQIALCLDTSAIDLANPDKNQIDPADLFGLTAQTYAELVERIRKCKLNLAKPLILDKPRRFAQSLPLGHVERNIFTFTAEHAETAEKKNKSISANSFDYAQDRSAVSAVRSKRVILVDGKIRIVSAPSARAEVQFVARQITKLVRQAGLRYRDIAVIASDIDRYENYIKCSFEDYQIPVFIDKRRPLNQHPVIDFLCSALAAVTNDFANNDIFAYLKTDLLAPANPGSTGEAGLDVDRDDVYLLENYCVAFGITGPDWCSAAPWRFAAEKAEKFNEQKVNQIRQKVISLLLPLHSQITGSGDLLTAKQFTKIIFDFLESAGVRKRAAEWVEKAFQQGDFIAADEHRQLFDRLVDLFDEFNETFTGACLSFSDYFEIIRCAFSQITLAFIPPALDQVLVGSIERSRHPDLKVVFLIGATERQFPSPVAFDSILSEEDRLAAQSSGIELSPGVRQELANRPYLAYIAFTRASDLLYITWPAVDQKSNAVVRSPFINDLCLLFEDLREEQISSTIPAPDEVFSRYDVEDLLCILKDDRLSPLAPKVARALGYENKAELNDEIAGQIFGRDLTSSASRLSTFAACPFKHFARYILDLKKRDEFKLEPLDIGTFYHSVLDAFIKRVVADKINFETVTEAALAKILDEEIDRLCRQDSFISKFASHNPHNGFIIASAAEYLRDCVISISQMIRAGHFRPVLSEISFGKPKSAGPVIGEFVINLSDGRRLSLNGRIDRMDVAQIDGRKTAIVFDYKTSQESFSWSEFFHGLDMQLPVYINAVLKSSDAHKITTDVAGAFYLPIKPKLNEPAISELADSQPKFAHRAKGIFNGQYFKLLDSALTSGWSAFYSFQLTEEKGQYANYNNSSVLIPDDYQAVLNFAENKIAETALQIVSGKITVQPYRLSGKSPCAVCDYKPVCRFDWQINDYNLLAAVDKQQAIAMITNTNEPKES